MCSARGRNSSARTPTSHKRYIWTSSGTFQVQATANIQRKSTLLAISPQALKVHAVAAYARARPARRAQLARRAAKKAHLTGRPKIKTKN